jgi:hypothetical protein
MKVKVKASEIRDCFIMGSRLTKLACYVNTAFHDVQELRGDYAKWQLRHAVADAYELGMLHRPKKKEFDRLGAELRHLSRHTKDVISQKSRSPLQEKLNKISERIVALHAGVKSRCGV